MRGFLARLGHMLGDAIVSFGLGPVEPTVVDCEHTGPVRGDVAFTESVVGDAVFTSAIQGDVVATSPIGHC